MKSGVQILFKFKKKQETDKAKTKNQIIELLSNRIIIMGVLLTALFCVLIYRLFVLQIIQGDEHLANFNYKIKKTIEIGGARGNIYDCKGKILAYNQLAYTVTLENSEKTSKIAQERTAKNGKNGPKVTENEVKNEVIYKLVKVLEQNGDTINYSLPMTVNSKGKLKFTREKVQCVDYGLDFYAPQTMETEDGRRVVIGWMQSWDNPMYPDTQRYSGMMTIPRELSMKDGRICQMPVRELENYRSNVISYDNVCIHEETELKGINGRSIDLQMVLKGKEYGKFRIKLAADEKHYSEIIYDRDEKTLTFDRTHSGFKKDTISTRSMYVSDKEDVINLRILVDRFSVEIFVNDGEQVMTSLIYTPVDASGISFASNGTTHLNVTKYDIEVK